MTARPGACVGPYEVSGQLGAGGMGEVWRATDTRLGREVALKLLPEDFAVDAERHARFEREAKTLAALNHPNIATLYGLEHLDGRHVLVMELIAGEGLDRRIARGPISVEEAVPVALQIAEALEAAHEKGIVHRDLKPANVMVRPDGTVKVLDFGLAKAWDEQAEGGSVSLSPTITQHHTRAGVILGTAAYMSPEQARGQAVDKRADIWAFGVVLYEMLTGSQLFAADTVSDTLAGVLKTEIDLDSLPASTPAAVRRLLHHCLQRNPKNRLHDIGDARLAIDDARAGRFETPPRPVAPAQARTAPRWRTLAPWLGGAVVGLGLAWLAGTRGAVPDRLDVGRASIRTLVSAGVSTDPSVSDDGRTLAFSSTRDGQDRVWIKDLTSGSESVLVGRWAILPACSPDGTAVLFMAGDERVPDLYRVSLATREQRLVARAAVFGDWAPGGREIVFLRDYDLVASRGGGELVVANLEGGGERVLHRDPGKRMNEPRWSPDGRWIVVVMNSFQSGTNDRLGLVDATTGSLEEVSLDSLGTRGLKLRGTAWVSPARLALLLVDTAEQINSSGRIALYDLVTGEATSLLPIANVGWGLDVAGADSLIVSVGSTDQNLHEARRDGRGGRWGDSELRTEGPFRDRQPVYSSDGRWLLFTSNRGGNLDIWRLDRGTGELQRLTDHGADDWDPAPSPDGASLIFSSNRTGRFQIWIAAADGSGPRQVTDVENAQNPTMTADGEWIVFVRQDAGEGKNGIWKIRPDGTDAAPIIAGAYLIPETSPDGRYVAVRGPGERRIVRIADGALLPAQLGDTDRYRWTTEGGATYLWTIGNVEGSGEIRRYAFDPERGALGPAQVVLAGDTVRRAETFGVARDGSAVSFASLANRRGQLVRIDGLTGLAGR